MGARKNARTVRRGDRRRPVQARGVDPGQQVALATAPALAELGEDPARGALAVLVVLHRVVAEVQVERRQQLVDVVAVLVLLGLSEHDQSAAALHEARDRRELIVAEPR